MVTEKKGSIPAAIFAVVVMISGIQPALSTAAGQGRAMEVEDIMTFRQFHDPAISKQGSFIVFEAAPDRGDGKIQLKDDSGAERITLDRGTKPAISNDERWIMSYIHRPYRDRMREPGDPDSLVALRTDASDTLSFGEVSRAGFTKDSSWLIVLHEPEDDRQDGERTGQGGELAVYSLADGSSGDDHTRKQFRAGQVRDFTVDSLSTNLVYAVTDSTGEENGLYRVDLLAETLEAERIHRRMHAVYDGFSWHNPGRKLAFLHSREDSLGNPLPASLHIMNGDNGEVRTAVASDYYDDERVLPLHGELTWSDDGDRLFFGWKPLKKYRLGLYEEEEENVTVADRDTILADAEVDVWHGDDPLIKTHEKNTWEQRRTHTYLSVLHVDSRRVVDLADEQVPYVSPADNPRYVLGRNPRPYKRKITWDGRYNDYYLIDLQDGSRNEIVDRLRATTVSLSPQGRYVVFYEAENWHLYDGDRNIIRNLTETLDVPFANEDHDYPFPAPGYGMAGWVEGDRAVLIYDKYDIWQIDTRSGEARNLTGGGGRETERQFRVVETDPDKDYFGRDERLLVRGFGEKDKTYGFYGIRVGREGYERYAEGPHRYRFVDASESGDRILYTRESYREFPDLHIADDRIRDSRKLTDLNPQTEEFDWGEARLVSWRDMDGEKLDGVLITPEGHQKGEKLPVLVYFYEQFSQRLHHFNEQVINHRPGFPFYVSNGYAVFLPDVRYDIGIPGYSATRSIVPGVNKLIDMGVADPDAIGLHGHSWSGYQAAHMVTQTNIFSAVIAGAPVSNMTSAYSGIRWGTGLARQFQYEQTQSRIGGSLWDKRERYIENSPVFFADRVETPMLIMFGDEDEAVPWEQGIELYLAMRRLQKDVIFLQYRGEPHHPQEYANKLDYFLRMKEYLDHYLKGKPAPDWIRYGIPYDGN